MSKRVFIYSHMVLYSPGKYQSFLFFSVGLFPLLSLVLASGFCFPASPFAVREIRGYVLMDKGKEKVWESFQKGAGLEGACRCV